MTTLAEAMGKKRAQSPQYDFLWRVELPVLSNTDPGINQQYIDPRELNHRIETFDSPFFQLDTKKVTNKNSFWYTASNNDLGSISLTIHDMEDGATLKYFTQWYNLIANPDGTYNPPVSYKKPVQFFRLSTKERDLYTYIYRGFFVTEIQTLSNSYESNDFTKYSITLTGDTIEYNFTPGSEIATDSSIMNEQWTYNQTTLASRGLA